MSSTSLSELFLPKLHKNERVVRCPHQFAFHQALWLGMSFFASLFVLVLPVGLFGFLFIPVLFALEQWHVVFLRSLLLHVGLSEILSSKLRPLPMPSLNKQEILTMANRN